MNGGFRVHKVPYLQWVPLAAHINPAILNLVATVLMEVLRVKVLVAGASAAEKFLPGSRFSSAGIIYRASQNFCSDRLFQRTCLMKSGSCLVWKTDNSHP
jgi:hypothetical protein